MLLFDWWNSSIAAGGALLTAHEIRALFGELVNLIQREDNLLRAELVSLNDNSRRSRDELRQELAEARRDMLTVLLNEGRVGRGTNRLNRLLNGGGSRSSGGGNDDNDGGGGWLSSLAEKTGLRAGGSGSGGGSGGGRTWDRNERGGDGDLSAWDAGFLSGLRAQLLSMAGGDSGEKGAGQQQQPAAVGEAPTVDDRYKAATATQ